MFRTEKIGLYGWLILFYDDMALKKMKFLLTASLILLLFIAFSVLSFSGNIRSEIYKLIPEFIIKNSTPPPTRQNNNAQTPIKTSVPANFRGPIGAPHIIGPSAPPPNY